MLQPKRAWEFRSAQEGLGTQSAFLTLNLDEEVACAHATANGVHPVSDGTGGTSVLRGQKRIKKKKKAAACYSGPVSHRALLCCGQKIKKSQYGQPQNIWGRSVLPRCWPGMA